MVCTSCGTENRAGSRFCDQCGAALALACPSCGEANRPDARFCAICGTPMGAGPAGEPPVSSAPPRTVGSPSSAERRLVTVLFADLVGFTSFAEDRDPEAVRELLSRYFDAATGIIERHGGTTEKFIGDAVMAVWGTPVAHEDDAERGVRAALEVLDAVRALNPGLEARCALLTGEAAVTLGATNQGMVAGDLVNTAARLQGVAEAGTVLVGEATMRAAAEAVVFEPIGDHSLKGKTAPVPAWRAVRVVSGRGGQGRTDALEAPFVGRDEELRLLKDQLHAVGRERRVRLVSVSGPGGIGKSRLVWELEKYLDGLQEGIYWHRGRSPSYGEGITFWALGEMVRRRAGLTEEDDEVRTRERVAATLDEFVDEPSERPRLEAAVLSLLGVEPAPAGGRESLFPIWRLFFERIAQRGTTVLVFEDLQWADSGLLDFIDHLIEWSRGLPILVITLARPELLDRRPDWGAGRRHFTSLALEPLSDDEIRQLLSGLVPGLPDAALAAIVRRAEGIPLYAVETVRALLADGRIERVGDAYRPTGNLSSLTVPESLRSLIASRLDALDPADRSLLQDASVLGQVFTADGLAAIAGSSADQLEPRLRDLMRREILDVESDPKSPERGQYKFVQSLIREVAYGTLARRDRRARHLAVARHYEATGDEEIGPILASHYLAAHAASDEGPEADAIAAQARLALSAAADRATALGAPDQAVVYLDQAIAIARDPRDRAGLLDRASYAAMMASREDGERYSAMAVEAYREVGDDHGVLRAQARLGQMLLTASELDRAIEVLRGALPDAERLRDEAVLAEILAYLARGHMRRGEADEAIASADRALVIAERLNLVGIVAEALINKGSAMGFTGRRRESVALLTGALELARSTGPVSRELRAWNNLASALGDDDPVRALGLALAAIERARDVGDRSHFNWLVGSTAGYRYGIGEGWDEQIALIDEALEAPTLPYDRVRLVSLRALLTIARGEDVAAHLEEVRSLVGDAPTDELRFPLEVTAAVAGLVTGRLDEAYRHGMVMTRLATQAPEFGIGFAADAASWAADLDRLRAVEALARGLPSTAPWTASLAARCSAAIAALEGRRAEALAGFRLAHDAVRDAGMRFELAVNAIGALALLPDEPEVRTWADEARETFQRIGARGFLDQLEAVAAAAESTPTTPSAQGTSVPTR